MIGLSPWLAGQHDLQAANWNAAAVGVLVLALAVPLIELARATSFVILMVFVLVNLALLRLKLRGVAPPAGAWRCPVWVPAAGAAVSLVLLAAQIAAFV